MSSRPRVQLTSLGAIALGLFAGACASTGATPRPFPTPEPTPVTGRTTAPPAAALAREGADTYALVATALGLRGVPYRNGGADRRGFDCSGFTQYVFAQHGVALPRGVRDQFRVGKTMKADELSPGDLIFFTTTASGASHVAIAVGGDEFVHAPSTTGVVRVERLSSSYWGPRVLGIRRVTALITPPGTDPS
jgi:cell wall-associated NlpC family hydrolase